MAIAKKSRDNLRNQRKLILTALEEYTQCVSEKLRIEEEIEPTKILRSIKGTSIRISKELLPDEFIHLVLAENDKKKYRIEFCQNCTQYVYIILHKPLIEEGQSILFFVFMKLIRFLDKKSKLTPRKNV
jgi:hypothetical protein